jgi:hypothetical protein
MEHIAGKTFSVLMAIAFIISGYFLLWKNKSRQPVLIAIWALFTTQCIIIMVQEYFFPGFGTNLTSINAVLDGSSLMLFSLGHWVFSF